MNTTEYTTFMVPNSDELQQLSELYKAMGDYTTSTASAWSSSSSP